jgi:hypothetical protein
VDCAEPKARLTINKIPDPTILAEKLSERNAKDDCQEKR